MIDRLLSFAEPDGDAYGAVAVTGEHAAACLCGGAGEVAPLRLDDAEVSRGEGSVRIGGKDGIVLGLASQTSQLGFEVGSGATVSVQAVGVSGEGPDGSGFEAQGAAWAFQGSPEVGAVRSAWARLGDGSLLVLFALRPADAADHADEALGAARIARDGAVAAWTEPLLSTEYDPSGAHVRATLELWGEEEAAPADRGAGTRRSGGSARLGGAALAAARFEWRLNGLSGFGGYEIVCF